MGDQQQSLPIRDIRAIIHGLKMSGFAFIGDESIREKIGFMIGELPSAENLDSLIDSPDELKKVEMAIGEIMKLVDMGGQRNERSKVTYEAKKNMPPRYNVLEWRRAMNNDLTKSLIRLSVFADNKEEPLIAEKALVLAKKSKTEAITENDMMQLKTAMDSSKLSKEAAMGDWWSGIKGGMQGLGQEVKNVGHGFVDPFKVGQGLARSKSLMQTVIKNVTALQQSLTQSQQWIQDPAFKQDLTNILNAVTPFTSNSQQIFDKLNEMEINYKRTKVPVGEGGAASSVPAGGQQNAPGATAGGDAAIGGSAPAAAGAAAGGIGPDTDLLGGGGAAPVEPAVGSFPSAAPTAAPSAAANPATTGVAPAATPAGAPAQKDIWQGVDRNKMLNIINQSIPDVWQSGYKGKAAAQMTDEELKQAITDNVGAKSLLTFLQTAKKRLMMNKLSQNRKWIRVA